MERKIKIVIAMLLVCVLAFAVAGCGNSNSGGSSSSEGDTPAASSTGGSSATTTVEPSGDPVIVKMCNVFAPDHTLAKLQHWFGDQLVERSGGVFVPEYYDSGALAAGDKEGVEMVMSNTAQVTYSTYFNLATMGGDNIKTARLFEIPFLFETPDAMYDFIENSEQGQAIVQNVSDVLGIGLIGGGFLQGTENIMTKFPISKPEDIKGKKLRVPGGIQWTYMFEAFGAAPLPMAVGEVYTALEQGTVEGLSTNVINGFTMGYHEVTDYMLVLDTKCNLTTIVYNQEFVDSLPADLRSIWDETAADLNQKLRDDMEAENAMCTEGLQEIMTEVVIPEGADLEAWKEITKSSWGNAIEAVGYDFFAECCAAANIVIPEQYVQ